MKKGYLILIIILITIAIATIYFINEKTNNIVTPLYKEEYTNYSWKYINYGYIIYTDGSIKQFDNSADKETDNLKEATITKKELNKLIELADKVSDNFEKDNSSQMIDGGTTNIQIYNKKINSWIVLSKTGSEKGNNNTDVAKEILEFTKQLKDKYLN